MESYYKKYKTGAIISGVLFVFCAVILIIAVSSNENGFIVGAHLFPLVIAVFLGVWFAFQSYKIIRLTKVKSELVKTFAEYVGYSSKTFGIYRPFRVFSLIVEIVKENGEKIRMSTPFDYYKKQINNIQIGEQLPISYLESMNILLINRDFKTMKNTDMQDESDSQESESDEQDENN